MVYYLNDNINGSAAEATSGQKGYTAISLAEYKGISTETKFDCPDGVDSTGNMLSVEYPILK